jgi:protein required for attachment to host cells
MLVPHGTLVMVVDGAHARLFRNVGGDIAPRLTLIEEEAHTSPRTSSMGTDRPGRVHESATTGRSSHASPDYHQIDEDRFAASAAERMTALMTGDVRMILIAPPHTLGIIRKHLKPGIRQHVLAEISKDYAERSPAEIAAMLERYEM